MKKELIDIYLEHLRREVNRATDELTRAIRILSLAMVEGQQNMLTGQLWYENLDEKNSIEPSIQKAVNAFGRNRDLRGLTPTEIHLNQAQVNGLSQVEVEYKRRKLVLPVVADQATLFNHIWVCCPDPETEVVGEKR